MLALFAKGREGLKRTEMSFFFGGRKAKPVEPSFSAPAGKPGTPLELVRYSTETVKFEIQK